MAKPSEQLLRDLVLEVALGLSERQLEQLATHFSMLLRWNEKINLTSVRRPEEIAARHFEESLFLAKLLPVPAGLLVDVGSGAGFPGLPLKITWPAVKAVLLEPNKKKVTFLKEVVRSCGLGGIEVRAERLEEAARGDLAGRAALVTMRAIKPSRELLGDVKRLLVPEGRAAFFLGEQDATRLTKAPDFEWHPPGTIPHSRRRVILVGWRRF